MAKLTPEDRKAALLSWGLLLAPLLVASWTILQTSATFVAQGRFIWESPTVYFLWWTWDVTLAAPVIVAAGCALLLWRVWPPLDGRAESRTSERILLWVAIVALTLTCVIGLVRSGSAVASMIRGRFEVGQHTFAVLLADYTTSWAQLFWLGLVVAVYLFLLHLTVSYRVHGHHAGRGVWGAERAVPVASAEQIASIDRFTVGRKQRELFIDLLTDGPRHISRIHEFVRPYTRSTAVRSLYTIDLAKAPSRGHIVLPVFATARGQLEDGLTVSRDGDRPLATLSSTEAAVYTAAVVRSAIKAAGGRAWAVYRGDRSLEREVLGFLSRSSAVAMMDEADQQEDALRFAQLLDAILRLPGKRESPLYRVVLLLAALYQSYPHVVSIGPDDVDETVAGRSITIAVERRTTPALTLASWRRLFEGARVYARRRRSWRSAIAYLLRFGRGKLMDQVRLVFGVRSNRLAHSLGNATRAQSYHLEFAGPEDTYMARQRIENIKGWEEELDLIASAQARAAPALGQRHSHLHIRNAGRHLGRFRYSVAYFERTPGSMAIAFVSAASSLLISLIVAFGSEFAAASGDVVTEGVATGNGSSLFELLFAFPIVGAAAGALRPGRSQWGGVLAARVANLVTIAVSVVALWLSFLGYTVNEAALPRMWLLVILVLAVVTVACLGSWLMRIAVHSRFVNPRDDDDEAAIAGVFSPESRPLRARPAVRSSRRARRARALVATSRGTHRVRSSEALADALGEVRIGPSVWVVPELWESRPWALPRGFKTMALHPDELKVAINLGVLTIDAIPSGFRSEVVQHLGVHLTRGAAARLLARVIDALDPVVTGGTEDSPGEGEPVGGASPR